jgi:DNA-directed RNA polymerase subunit RPC12/RpoP
LEDQAQLLGIDVDRRTTRGRACPRCGGKIIPSRRAVYQSSGDPNAVFPAWQCERCGYEEIISRPVKAAARHGAPAESKTVPGAAKAPVAATPGSRVAPAESEKPPAIRAAPILKDRKGRSLPADVNRMMAEMTRQRTKES